MSINLTLIGQMITFIVFIWFTMKYVWPPVITAMRNRQKTISDGLAAAERGKHELELAQHKATGILRDAKLEASHIIEKSNQRALQIVEEAREKARQDTQQILDHAQTQVEQLTANAKDGLRQAYAGLVVEGAEKILQEDVSKAAHEKMLNELAAEL